MSAKHTKGPWKVGSRELFSDGSREGFFKIEGFVGDSNEQEYRVANVVDANDSPQNEANARLIAAAPELLEALDALLASHRQFTKESGGCDHSVGICMCEDFRVQDAARAAIAKVRK